MSIVWIWFLFRSHTRPKCLATNSDLYGWWSQTQCSTAFTYLRHCLSFCGKKNATLNLTFSSGMWWGQQVLYGFLWQEKGDEIGLARRFLSRWNFEWMFFAKIYPMPMVLSVPLFLIFADFEIQNRQNKSSRNYQSPGPSCPSWPLPARAATCKLLPWLLHLRAKPSLGIKKK